MIDHLVINATNDTPDVVRYGLQLPVLVISLLATSRRFYLRWYEVAIRVGLPLFGLGTVVMTTYARPEHMPLVGARLLLVAFFCYFMLLPLALRASFQYSEWLGFAADEWRAEDYLGFVCKFLLGMGLGFELPVVILTLVKIGVLNATRLAGMRRYMIVINLVLGAVLTTPEVVTQVLMFIPLQGFYELSVWIARYWELDERGKARARRNLIIVFLLLLGLAGWASWHYHFGLKEVMKFFIG